MTSYDLPIKIKIDGKYWDIRNKCDYRVVLDCINALNDVELDDKSRIQCALFIFYENATEIVDVQTAVLKMFNVIGYGETNSNQNKPKLMDWEHDFRYVAPAISSELGYDVRTPKEYTHWWTFIGAYLNIDRECMFSTIVSIRNKRFKGKKLEKWEEEFYRNNKSMVDIPQQLTEEEQAELNSPW